MTYKLDFLTTKFALDTGERIVRLHEQLRRLEEAEYPSDDSVVLIRLLTELTDWSLRRLVDLTLRARQHTAVEARQELQDQMSRISLLVSQLVAFADIVELSQSDRNPRELTLPVRRLLRQIHPMTRLVICPLYAQTAEMEMLMDNYVYYALMGAVKRVLGKIVPTEGYRSPEPQQATEAVFPFSNYPEHIVAILYPFLLKDSTLQHAAIGHEIGEFVNDAHGLASTIGRSRLIDDEVDREISDLRESVDLESRLRSIDQVDQIARVKEHWIREICADVCAIHVLGPAAFLAIASYVVARQGLDWFTGDYPPARWRIKLMLEELEEMPYFREPPVEAEACGVYEAFESEVCRWREIVSLDVVPQGSTAEGGAFEPHVRFARAFQHLQEEGVIANIRHQIGALLSSVISRVGTDFRYQPNFWRLSQLVNLLEQGIPPSQVSEDVLRIYDEKDRSGADNEPSEPPLDDDDTPVCLCSDFAEILNAGWAYRILQSKNEELGWDCRAAVGEYFHQRLRKQDRLIARAIEMGELERVFNQRRKLAQQYGRTRNEYSVG